MFYPYFRDGPTLKIIDHSYFCKMINSENQHGMKYLFSSLYCNYTFRECAGSPRQWCSWDPYYFRVFQNHNCSLKRPYRNNHSCSKKFAKYAIPHRTQLKKSKCYCYWAFNWKWPMKRKWRIKKANNHLLVFSTWILLEYTHTHWASFSSRWQVSKCLLARIRTVIYIHTHTHTHIYIYIYI